jgi:NodT family efflux transporter outer membrane factor (OMF) lipoprotein
MKTTSVFICAFLLCGCVSLTTSDYQRPMLSIPKVWQYRGAESGIAYLHTTPHWWDHFNDPQLSQLIEGVLRSNNDLAQAGLQVLMARNNAGMIDTQAHPDISLSGNADNSKAIRESTSASENYSAGLSLSYEVDLWGKVRHAQQQAEWQVKASEQDRLATVLTVIGTLSQLYWQIGNQNQKIANLERSSILAQQTLELVDKRYAAGAISKLDVLQAKQTLLGRQNTLQTMKQQRAANRNALAVLFDRPPAQHLPELRSLAQSTSGTVDWRRPVEVLSLRPDIQSAEMSLRASLSGLDVARVSFYPSLSLTAGLSAGSDVFSQWFQSPVRTLGSSLALPFVQWNTAELSEARSRLLVRQAAVKFRDTVYVALKEVDDAIAAQASARQQKINQVQALTLSQQQLQLVENRYAAGSVDYQTLLDAQNTVLETLNTLSDLQYNDLYATMQLWLALGGGYSLQHNNYNR